MSKFWTKCFVVSRICKVKKDFLGGQKEYNLNKSNKARCVANLVLFIGLILSACNPADQPLQITSVKVFPRPIVGRIVTLEIEIMSADDEADVKFTMDTLEYAGNKIHLVSGATSWQGSLVANQPQRFQVKVCVIEEGSWPVELYVVSYLPENNVWSDAETIHLESSLYWGKVIPGSAYTFDQEEYATRSTPRPITVSLECSGNLSALAAVLGGRDAALSNRL